MKPWTRTFWVLVDLGWLHHEVAEDKPHKRKWKASWCFEDISGWHRIVRSIVVTWLVLGANSEGRFFFLISLIGEKKRNVNFVMVLMLCLSCLKWYIFRGRFLPKRMVWWWQRKQIQIPRQWVEKWYLFRYVLPGKLTCRLKINDWFIPFVTPVSWNGPWITTHSPLMFVDFFGRNYVAFQPMRWWWRLCQPSFLLLFSFAWCFKVVT